MYLSVWIVGNDLFVRLIRLLQHANVCHRTSVSCRMQSKKCSHTSRLSTLHTEIHTKMRYNMIQSMTVCLRVISMTGVCEEHKHASLQMTWEEKRWCRKCKRRQMGTTCAHLIHHVFVGSQESLQIQLSPTSRTRSNFVMLGEGRTNPKSYILDSTGLTGHLENEWTRMTCQQTASSLEKWQHMFGT